MVTKPAARRRDPEGARRRILAAAAEGFASAGFAGTRVDAVAARAGINKRMLYHYFGDKQGLERAVLAVWFASETSGDGDETLSRQGARLLLWALLEDAVAWHEPPVVARLERRTAELRRGGRLPTRLDPERLAEILFWGGVVLAAARAPESAVGEPSAAGLAEAVLHDLTAWDLQVSPEGMALADAAAEPAVATKTSKPRVRLKASLLERAQRLARDENRSK